MECANTARRRVTARKITVRTILLQALNIRDFQLEGAPKWLDSERYHIDAKATLDGQITPAELMQMMRNLPVSRFGLSFHHDTKEAPIYSLVAAKNGTKLHPNTGMPGHSTDWGKDHINANDVTLTELADVLEVQMDRIVRNDNRIDGVFDFKLIFTALQEQDGLRLVATKGPVEMTVIDRVERPTED